MKNANGSSSTALFFPVVNEWIDLLIEQIWYVLIDSQGNMLGIFLINSIKINRLPEVLNFSKSESW
jgi:hypothetical protein